jgi:hypothetical protein
MKRALLIGLGVMLVAAAAASLVWANGGPVSYWPLDGNTNDAVGVNHGVNHLATFVPGVLGQALYFDGTTYVEVANDPSLEPLDTITVAAWVKRDGSPGAAKYIVSKYLPDRHGSHSSYGLYTGGGGLRFYVGHAGGWIGSPQAAAGAVWDGEWHCVAGTFDGSYVKLYVDGSQVDGATSDLQDIYYHEEGNLFFGHYYQGDWLAFSGYVDEVRIWNRALTLEEVVDSCRLRLEVAIDIKPGSDPNCFNSDGHGVIPVAILGSADFDASTIDPFSVALDGAAVRVKGKSGNAGSLEDVNGDGFLDLVVQIIDDSVYAFGDTSATLTGELIDGTPIQGTDTICIRPPE